MEEAGEAALEVAQEEVATQEGIAQARKDVVWMRYYHRL